jgi:hypothetical protein
VRGNATHIIEQDRTEMSEQLNAWWIGVARNSGLELVAARRIVFLPVIELVLCRLPEAQETQCRIVAGDPTLRLQ